MKRYGTRVALRDLELTVPEGSFYVLGGQNGAGKTTLFRVLLDLVRADAGEARVLGFDAISSGPEARTRIGYVPERNDAGYDWLTPTQLLRHHAAYFPSWDDSYAAELARSFRIPGETKFGRLSKGEKRKTQLVMALAHRPSLLLLDEPTDGLDPLSRERVLSVLADHLAATQTTVLAATHVVHVLEGLADHLGVMHEGEFVCQATRDHLAAQLRRYRARIPEGWKSAPELNGSVVHRQGSAREIAWTIWGAEDDIAHTLTQSGAEISEISPLNLEGRGARAPLFPGVNPCRT